jgi:hypothetical protein
VCGRRGDVVVIVCVWWVKETKVSLHYTIVHRKVKETESRQKNVDCYFF